MITLASLPSNFEIGQTGDSIQRFQRTTNFAAAHSDCQRARSRYRQENLEKKVDYILTLQANQDRAGSP
jgi:hypothetical protein